MSTPTDNQIIDFLGGTCAVAALCEIRPPSVSDWRKYGIPKPWRKYLKSEFPAAFADRPDEMIEES